MIFRNDRVKILHPKYEKTGVFARVFSYFFISVTRVGLAYSCYRTPFEIRNKHNLFFFFLYVTSTQSGNQLTLRRNPLSIAKRITATREPVKPLQLSLNTLPKLITMAEQIFSRNDFLYFIRAIMLGGWGLCIAPGFVQKVYTIFEI